jgi:hypothetical protein
MDDALRLTQILVWPLVAMIALVIFRRPIGRALVGLSNRATKLDLRVVSLELAPALTRPQWQFDDVDFRHLTSDRVFDSHSYSLFAQLQRNGGADVAIIDLGAGKDWLTSRLYLFSALLEELQGVRCLVFLADSDAGPARVLGLASPQSVRKALKDHEPWLGQTYVAAYARHRGAILRQTSEEPRDLFGAWATDIDLSPGGDIEIPQAQAIAETFVRLNQRKTTPPDTNAWRRFRFVDPGGSTEIRWEHTQWIRPKRLPRALALTIGSGSVVAIDPESPLSDRNRRVMLQERQFVALTETNGTLRGVVDRISLVDDAFRRAVPDEVST